MQDRYTADVGDFMKLGLLRHFASPTTSGGAGLSLAINWYRAPAEWHNRDGKHISYLSPNNRWQQSLRACDPDLMLRLARVVARVRSIEALETVGALPGGSTTHREMLDPVRGPASRRDWHERALVALPGRDLVFADPDNGIHKAPRPAKLHKFALVDELADYAGRGQSLVVYQHADRSADRLTQARRKLAELADAVTQRPVAAVIARRGTCRFFLITAGDRHWQQLAESLRSYAERWSPHAELVW
jgi:hypothetical protein